VLDLNDETVRIIRLLQICGGFTFFQWHTTVLVYAFVPTLEYDNFQHEG
jgi:hypothetical protein